MYRIALCQMTGSLSEDPKTGKAENRRTAERMLREAAAGGANIAVLPEMWNTPYANACFRPFAEEAEGPTAAWMSRIAAELQIYLIGGSIPERDRQDRIYNTCFCFGKDGSRIGCHRKAHLFDVDIPGRAYFKESDTLTAGDQVTVIHTEYGRIGVQICFDVRFPELSRKMALEGAELLVLPAAFTVPTGEAHWDVTMRMRAIDNQIFFAACSPARNPKGGYQAYGGSCVADPWGVFLSHADEKPQVVFADIDPDRISEVRGQLPIFSGRRPELYR